MNWKSGFWRLWLLFSGGWILSIAVLAYLHFSSPDIDLFKGWESVAEREAGARIARSRADQEERKREVEERKREVVARALATHEAADEAAARALAKHGAAVLEEREKGTIEDLPEWTPPTQRKRC